MNTSLASLITSQHDLELDAHVSVDDAIAKSYEEAHELSLAIDANNTVEIQKESRDVLINILSVSSRYIDVDALVLPESAPLDIHSMIALWARQTASIRKRYSREDISLEEYAHTVAQLVSYLVSLSGTDIHSAVGESLEKFRGRIGEYLPDITLADSIAHYQDFPKPGILFHDIAPLLADTEAMRYAGYELAKLSKDADIIAGLDARGFIFATLVATILDKPFVMIRKKGKLPGETVGTDYSLEYGDNSIEMQKDAIKPGQKVVIIDDLLATGGTLGAAAGLVEKVGGKVESLICLIGLDDPFLVNLPSRKSLHKYKVETVLQY